jgi:hypothetical protein
MVSVANWPPAAPWTEIAGELTLSTLNCLIRPAASERSIHGTSVVGDIGWNLSSPSSTTVAS